MHSPGMPPVQFEAWLSFQKPTADGLVGVGLCHGADIKPRCTVMALHDTGSAFEEALEKTWSRRTTSEAYKALSHDQIQVTNKSDKTMQLHKIPQLDDLVKMLMKKEVTIFDPCHLDVCGCYLTDACVDPGCSPACDD